MDKERVTQALEAFKGRFGEYPKIGPRMSMDKFLRLIDQSVRVGVVAKGLQRPDPQVKGSRVILAD